MVILFPYGQRNELLEMAEVTRSLLSFDRGIRQPDHRDLVGVTPSGVDFDLHLKRLDSDDRR